MSKLEIIENTTDDPSLFRDRISLNNRLRVLYDTDRKFFLEVNNLAKFSVDSIEDHKYYFSHMANNIAIDFWLVGEAFVSFNGGSPKLLDPNFMRVLKMKDDNERTKYYHHNEPEPNVIHYCNRIIPYDIRGTSVFSIDGKMVINPNVIEFRRQFLVRSY